MKVSFSYNLATKIEKRQMLIKCLPLGNVNMDKTNNCYMPWPSSPFLRTAPCIDVNLPSGLLKIWSPTLKNLFIQKLMKCNIIHVHNHNIVHSFDIVQMVMCRLQLYIVYNRYFSLISLNEQFNWFSKKIRELNCQ